jgi:homospermidine synthase
MNLDQRRQFYLGPVLYQKAQESTEGITEHDLKEQAKKHGISIEELKANVSLFGSFREDLGSKRILQIGAGGIGNNILDFYDRHFIFETGQILVVDKNEKVLERSFHHSKIIFKKFHVLKENYKSLFESFLRKGDIIVDLGYYVDTLEVISWCKDNGVLFVNAAVEEWETSDSNELQYPKLDARTYSLYLRQMKIQETVKSWNKTPTAILTIGANPGVVSYMSKVGMKHWVQHLAKSGSKWSKLPQALELISQPKIDYPKLAHLMNIQVIQITERDTLRQSDPRKNNEFICTWSPQGFIEEGIATAELGWGTHETMTEEEGALKYKKGPRNQVCFPSRGVDTLVMSYVPSGNYVGYLVRHEEAFSISDYLTVKDQAGNAVYRPTVYYAYYPCSDAVASVFEMRSNGYKQPDSLRLPKKELIDGLDELGCFLLSGDKEIGNWWIGTIQSVADAEELCPGQSPTTLVVTAGVFTGIVYALHHPAEGVIHPEAMNVDESMDLTLPYWYPLKSYHVPKWEPHVQARFHYKGEKEKDDNPNWIIEKFLV